MDIVLTSFVVAFSYVEQDWSQALAIFFVARVSYLCMSLVITACSRE
jgi:hypothetical protein